MNVILQYIDAIWLIIALIAVDKAHRRTAFLFVLGCIFMMRLQVEMMISIGYPTGILDFMSTNLFSRAMLVYTACYLIYFIVMHFSAKNDKSIVLASSLGTFFMVFVASTVIMLL